jgi:hypothetical protein
VRIPARCFRGATCPRTTPRSRGQDKRPPRRFTAGSIRLAAPKRPLPRVGRGPIVAIPDDELNGPVREVADPAPSPRRAAARSRPPSRREHGAGVGRKRVLRLVGASVVAAPVTGHPLPDIACGLVWGSPLQPGWSRPVPQCPAWFMGKYGQTAFRGSCAGALRSVQKCVSAGSGGGRESNRQARLDASPVLKSLRAAPRWPYEALDRSRCAGG